MFHNWLIPIFWTVCYTTVPLIFLTFALNTKITFQPTWYREIWPRINYELIIKFIILLRTDEKRRHLRWGANPHLTHLKYVLDTFVTLLNYFVTSILHIPSPALTFSIASSTYSLLIFRPSSVSSFLLMISPEMARVSSISFVSALFVFIFNCFYLFRPLFLFILFMSSRTFCCLLYTSIICSPKSLFAFFVSLSTSFINVFLPL